MSVIVSAGLANPAAPFNMLDSWCRVESEGGGELYLLRFRTAAWCVVNFKHIVKIQLNSYEPVWWIV